MEPSAIVPFGKGPSMQPLDPSFGATPPAVVREGQSVEDGAGGFMELLGDLAADVSEAQNKANEQVAQLAAGNSDNVHQVMLSLAKAEISFDYMMAVRSRLLETYKEVMRMQL